MKLGLVQFSPIWEDKNKNIKKIDDLISTIDQSVDALVFPEMTLTGFTMNSKINAEEIDGLTFVYFMNLASKLKVDIFAGIIEKEDKSFFNSLIHFNPDGLIKAKYKKIHPFSMAKEDKAYRAGDEVVVTKIDKSKIGLTICYDLRFPELYRLYAKENVDILINIANWPIKRIEHWRHLLKARAIENQCFMVGVNRVGNDPFNEYSGNSSVFDPMGNEIVLVENDERIIYADIDIEQVKETKERLQFLKDIKLI